MKSRDAGSNATVHARPDSSGLRGLVHVVAVEIHAGFEAQRVARAEAAGGDAERVQLLPDAHGILRGQHDFEAVFAGVAGARDEPAIDLAADECARARVRPARPRVKAASRTSRALRALHGEHREVRALVDLDVEVRRVLADPGEILVARAGVHDHAEPGFVEEVDDEIVDDAAGLVEHAAVERLAGLVQLADVVGEQALRKGAHVLAAADRRRTCAKRRRRRRRAARRGARRSASCTAPACPSRRSRRCGRRARWWRSKSGVRLPMQAPVIARYAAQTKRRQVHTHRNAYAPAAPLSCDLRDQAYPEYAAPLRWVNRDASTALQSPLRAPATDGERSRVCRSVA